MFLTVELHDKSIDVTLIGSGMQLSQCRNNPVLENPAMKRVLELSVSITHACMMIMDSCALRIKEKVGCWRFDTLLVPKQPKLVHTA